MNEYIFYSAKSSTKAPDKEFAAENHQVLGRAFGMNAGEAKKRLLSENPWIKEAGYNPDEIIACQVVTDELRRDVATVVDYLWTDEERHYEEGDCPAGHIFETLRRLKTLS